MTRSHTYPQVDPRAAGTIDAAVAVAPRGASAGRALAGARLRDAVAVAVGPAFVLREDLARAAGLGLDGLPAVDLARPLPVLDARVTEIAARRHLAAGAPLVIVRERGRPIGAVSARSIAAEEVSPGTPMVARLRSTMAPAALAVVTLIGRIAAERDARAFLVGGAVRDLLRAADV